MTDFNELWEAIDTRFPNANFTISCFKSIDEIENKTLIKANKIIYQDQYLLNGEKLQDFYLIEKKMDKDYIYYCDVIDELIKQEFIRNDCDHQFLENIRQHNDNINRRNKNSIPIFSSFWGS